MIVEREILDIGAAVDKIITERLGRMFVVNLNDAVKVRLTDLGKEIYYHRYDDLNLRAGKIINNPKFPEEDTEGYAEFQLWDFIQLYGGYIGMARPNVIEPLDIVCPMHGHGDPPGEPGPRGVPCSTNADRIRAMTDEELAKKMSGLESFALTCGGGWPTEKWLEWLRQEDTDADN